MCQPLTATLPGDFYVVLFWGMTCFLMRGYTILLQQEVHRSLQVIPPNQLHKALVGGTLAASSLKRAGSFRLLS